MSDPEHDRPSRWSGRPVQSALLRVAIIAVPIAAGVAASAAFSALVPYPKGAVAVAGWWVGVLALSSVTVIVVDRQARRLLPLVALLKLSMIFPDEAPSRFGVALRAGTVRSLEQRKEEMRRRGIEDEPSRAAARILELVGALAVHDRVTRGHAERVRAYADLLGAEMGLTAEERDRLHWAALLHDVGKTAVPTDVLNKPGKLDASEWEVIKRHPEEGAKLAAPLRPWLGEWADTIEQHHERWDGTGYPKGLTGEEISRGARIVGVADAFEVMTAARSYKRPMDVAAAREELIRGAGAQFDPAAVRSFLTISFRRQRWIAGPVAWLSGLPFLRNVPGGVGGQAAGIAARVAAAGTVLAAAVAPAVSSGGGVARVAAPARAPASTPETGVVPRPPLAETPPGAASAEPEPASVSGPTPARAQPVAYRAAARPASTSTTTTPSPRPAPPPASPSPPAACVLTDLVSPVSPSLGDAVRPVCSAVPPIPARTG